MKTLLLTAGAALLMTTTVAGAVGLDRSGRPVDLIFEAGNIVELTFGYADATIDGTDVAGLPTGNIIDSFRVGGAGFRYELNDQIAVGLLVSQPYGADILYGPSSPILGGTAAFVDSTAATLFGRYKFDDNWSAHAGIVYQNVRASVTLSGLAYQAAGLNGYRADFASDQAFGYMVGGAYEIPEIALRVSLTYYSEIDHEFDTTQTFNGAIASAPTTTDVTTPETVELAFQTGVAADTLVFGSVRFSHYSVTQVQTSLLGGASLTDLENAFDAELGVGRRFNDQWAGSLSIGWEEQGEDSLVSPLGSTNGATFVSVGASYQATDDIEISGGVRYTNFGNATGAIGAADSVVGSFSGNDAISGGLRVRYSF